MIKKLYMDMICLLSKIPVSNMLNDVNKTENFGYQLLVFSDQIMFTCEAD